MVGFRHNATGRSTGRVADKRIRSRLGPPKGEPWVFQTVQMLESPAYQSLSINARRALDRLEIEHRAHAGLEMASFAYRPASFTNSVSRKTA